MDPRYRRIFVIVLDAMGVGEAPDSAAFDDVGADTLGSIARTYDCLLYTSDAADD